MRGSCRWARRARPEAIEADSGTSALAGPPCLTAVLPDAGPALDMRRFEAHQTIIHQTSIAMLDPHMSLLTLPYVVSGFGVGFVVGMTGMGGGSLMTPLLLLGFGVHAVTAVGTDLLFAAVTKSFGTAVHQIGRNVDWGMVGLLAAGSVPATLIMTLVLHRSNLGSGAVSGLITHVLGFALLLTALCLVWRRYIIRFSEVLALDAHPGAQRAGTILLGALLGVLVTLSSVGAGAIGVAVLLVLYPRLPGARIIGSDIAHAVPLTLLAGLGHLLIGAANLPLLASLLIGSLPGVVLGSLLAPRVSERFLRLLISVILAAVGGRLVIA